MPPRLLTNTKWLYFVVLNVGSIWNPVSGVAARNIPTPTTVEAQAKFFQDFFSVQLSPYKIEFGHVCEDPNTWEQRYEKKDFKNHRDMGKVRWGDKKGGYGEHYWDLNHAGHAGKHGNDGYDGDSDDGSYNPDRDHTHDSYEEPNDHAPTYEKDDYDPEKYEESNRAKRAHPRTKIERKTVKHEEYYEEPESERPQKQTRKNKESLQTAPSHNVEKYSDDSDDEDVYKKPLKKKYKQRHQEYDEEEHEQSRESSNQYPIPKKENEDSSEQPTQYVSRAASKHYVPYEQGEGVRQHQQPEPNIQYSIQKKESEDSSEQPVQYVSRAASKHYVPYEHGGGVREHQQPEITVAASAPRLFLEPSTGHVVDRATGQAYVLQPVVINKSYN